MSASFPPCPFLPPALPEMSWKSFAPHGKDRDEEFYFTALQYGNYLWQRGRAARAILCLDRAFGAELDARAPVLREWPLPYEAMAWILAHTPPDVFIGNPRVHFQHFADRMNEPRRDPRRWRAWACWDLACTVLPHFPGDPKHRVREPSLEEIFAELQRHGLPGEAELWRRTRENYSNRSAARNSI